MLTTWIVTERSETTQRDDDAPRSEVTLARTFWYVVDGTGDDAAWKPVEPGGGNVGRARGVGEPDGTLVIEVQSIGEWPVGRHVVMDLAFLPDDA